MIIKPSPDSRLLEIRFSEEKPPYAHLIRSIFTIILLLVITQIPPPGDGFPAAKASSGSGPVDPYRIYEKDVILIKFDEAHRIRLRNKVPAAIDNSVSAAQMQALYALAAGGEWQRAHTTAEATLDQLRRRGEERSGTTLPDLNNEFHLHLPQGMEAVAAAEMFNQSVQFAEAFLIPLPAPAPIILSDYSQPGNSADGTFFYPYQRYLDPAPEGIDARYAWGGSGGTGAGIKICDIEQDFNSSHADYSAVTRLGADLSSPYGDNHGTAVLGIYGGRDNGYGVKGIAYDASLYFTAHSSLLNYTIGNAITRCMAALDAGDIILLEAQIAGPNYTPPAEPDQRNQFGLVPVEWYKPTYDAIVTAVANGIIVVEAAGNGEQNLDNSDYTSGNGGHYPFKSENDSGAIIVGAGQSPSGYGANARIASSFTNYGSTVDLQGWGDGIVTTGYGNFYDGDGKNLWYTASFGGTSGASPIVTGAAAVIQSTHETNLGGRLTPAEMKQLLQSTGTPQQGSKHIGPLPNLRAAIEGILGASALTVVPPLISPADGFYSMPLQVSLNYGDAGQNSSNTEIHYTLDSSEPTRDSPRFRPGQEAFFYLSFGAAVKAKAFQYDPATARFYGSETVSGIYINNGQSTPKVAMPDISPGGGIYDQPHTVTLSTATAGATIYYTTNGSDPSEASTLYSGPFTLPPSSDYEIKARAYKSGHYPSDIASSGPLIVRPASLPAPTFFPPPGDYNGAIVVFIDTTIAGAEIRFTTDGSTPSASSPLYVEPIELSSSATVRARIYVDGFLPGNVADALYNITGQAARPTITPNGGTATGSVQISLATTTPGATIRYTTNGGTPTAASTLYSAPFSRGIGEHTIKARAFLNGAQPSEVAEADFIVYDPSLTQVAAPTVNPPGGNHTGPLVVEMNTATEGATIYYTTDGTIPTQSSFLYSGPLLLPPQNFAYTFRVKAFKTGLTPSNFTPASFNVFQPAGITVTTPTISPNGGTFTDTIRVTMAITTPFAQLHHTTDGSDPVKPVIGGGNTPPFSFNLSKPATVKALGTRLAFYDSEIASADFAFICDTPEITGGGIFTASVEVALSTTTPLATIYYTTDGTEPGESAIQYTTPFTLGVGATTVKARCFRNNFAESETAADFFLVNPSPVTPTITSHPSGQTVDEGTAVSFSVVATGAPTPTYQWQRDGANLVGATEPSLLIPDARPGDAGDYRVLVSNSGGTIASNVAVLVVNEAPATETAISGLVAANDGPTSLGNVTTFNATIAEGTNVTYAWDFGDGNGNTGQTVGHTYAAAGIYTAILTASNSLGSQTATTTVTVTPAAAPISGLSASNDGPTLLGHPTTLSATITGGTDVTYAWDFGDSSAGSGQSASHTYAAAGIFTATVTASNSLGSESATTTVTVTEAATPELKFIYLPLVLRNQ